MKDVNDFFDGQKSFLIEYYGYLKEATIKADRMTSKHKGDSTFFRCRTNFKNFSKKFSKYPQYFQNFG